jgi:predicted DNA-binding transcriptional regulator AlpA
MAKRLIRVPAACARLGVGKTKLYEFVADGRLQLVNIGPTSVAVIEDPDDALIEDLINKGHTPRSVPIRTKATRARRRQRA